jgi:hypothetical protein
MGQHNSELVPLWPHFGEKEVANSGEAMWPRPQEINADPARETIFPFHAHVMRLTVRTSPHFCKPLSSRVTITGGLIYNCTRDSDVNTVPWTRTFFNKHDFHPLRH